MEHTEYYENKLGYEIAIAEMRRKLEAQDKSITAVKRIVENVFTASSLVIGLSGALGIFRAQVAPGYIVFYNVLLFIAILLYILVIVLSVWILQPVEIHSPVEASWDVLFDYYVRITDDVAVLKQHLNNYLNAIHLNEPIIAQRRKRANYTSLILPVIAFILFVLSWIN
ncbi:MAG: hypothetical protein MUO64_12490 [Anaerolineales bacterium]|nr:hypothetical protein [Anaerolineales bacterium]